MNWRIFTLLVVIMSWIPAYGGSKQTTDEPGQSGTKLVEWYKTQQSPSALLKLEYAEFLAGMIWPPRRDFKADEQNRKDVVLICKELAVQAEWTSLSESQRRRLFVLGIIGSTNRTDELMFAEYLRKEDPNNGLAAACLLEPELVEQDWVGAVAMVKQILECEYIFFYEEYGAALRFDIWVKCFGSDPNSIRLLHQAYGMPSLAWNKVIAHVCSLHKYEAYRTRWAFPHEEHYSIPLDLFYLYRSKMGKQIGWLSFVCQWQSRCFVQFYGYLDAPTLIPKSQWGDEYKRMLAYRKLIDEQNKVIGEITGKAELEADQTLPRERIDELVLLAAQGRDWQMYNSLPRVGSTNEPARLVDNMLVPLLEKEKKLWHEILDVGDKNRGHL